MIENITELRVLDDRGVTPTQFVETLKAKITKTVNNSLDRLKNALAAEVPRLPGDDPKEALHFALERFPTLPSLAALWDSIALRCDVRNPHSHRPSASTWCWLMVCIIARLLGYQLSRSAVLLCVRDTLFSELLAYNSIMPSWEAVVRLVTGHLPRMPVRRP